MRSFDEGYTNILLTQKRDTDTWMEKSDPSRIESLSFCPLQQAIGKLKTSLANEMLGRAVNGVRRQEVGISTSWCQSMRSMECVNRGWSVISRKYRVRALAT